MIPDAIRVLLACPRCHGPLEDQRTDGAVTALRCPPCRIAFPVREGIPVLLLDQAVPR